MRRGYGARRAKFRAVEPRRAHLDQVAVHGTCGSRLECSEIRSSRTSHWPADTVSPVRSPHFVPIVKSGLVDGLVNATAPIARASLKNRFRGTPTRSRHARAHSARLDSVSGE